MQTVTVSRHVDAAPDAVRALVDDLGAFMRAADFDGVHVDGDEIRLVNQVGIARMELTLGVDRDADVALAYEQREGIFESMRTEYTVEPADGGTTITATTEFAVDVALVGSLLDATVVKRQRRKELEAQFDWVAETAG
ncbi:MAG: SRPBCC family protein [Halobacteriaceae archaeon]